MRCADCPDLRNGTRKRAVCCQREGELRRRAAAEDRLREALDNLVIAPSRRARKRAIANALSGTQLTSEPGGAFRKHVYNGGER